MPRLSVVAPDRLTVGMSVEVRSRFVGAWTRGFEIVTLTQEEVELRRRSDRSLLPVRFARGSVRPDLRSS
jgi:hypothetical protein